MLLLSLSYIIKMFCAWCVFIAACICYVCARDYFVVTGFLTMLDMNEKVAEVEQREADVIRRAQEKSNFSAESSAPQAKYVAVRFQYLLLYF